MMPFRLASRITGRSVADLQADSATVHYDLEMLFGAAAKYGEADAKGDRIGRNAAVESFAVHCRALILFLFGHVEGLQAAGQKPQKFRKEQDNDIFAWDYYPGWQFDCPEPSEVLYHAKWRADKHVAHITTERRGVNQPGTGKESVWELRDTVDEIARAMSLFLNNAPAYTFDTAKLAEMKAWLAPWAAGATATTTTPTIAMSGPQVNLTPMIEAQAKTDARTIAPGPMINPHGKTK